MHIDPVRQDIEECVCQHLHLVMSGELLEFCLLLYAAGLLCAIRHPFLLSLKGAAWVVITQIPNCLLTRVLRTAYVKSEDFIYARRFFCSESFWRVPGACRDGLRQIKKRDDILESRRGEEGQGAGLRRRRSLAGRRSLSGWDKRAVSRIRGEIYRVLWCRQLRRLEYILMRDRAL